MPISVASRGSPEDGGPPASSAPSCAHSSVSDPPTTGPARIPHSRNKCSAPVNDQAAGLGAKVVQGTIRDSLHMIDVWFSQDGGQRPDIIVTDAGSYSDLVFGPLNHRGWQPVAEGGLLAAAARAPARAPVLLPSRLESWARNQ
ncbi:MAG: Tn3 family transposase [Streptosporangiaceae bacterium]